MSRNRINTSDKGNRAELEMRHLLEPYGEVIVDRICSKGPYDFRFIPYTDEVYWARLYHFLVYVLGVEVLPASPIADDTQSYWQIKSNSVGNARKKFAAWPPTIFGPGLKVVAVRYDGSRHKPVRWTVEIAE